jgi:hypothetical protein
LKALHIGFNAGGRFEVGVSRHAARSSSLATADIQRTSPLWAGGASNDDD